MGKRTPEKLVGTIELLTQKGTRKARFYHSSRKKEGAENAKEVSSLG